MATRSMLVSLVLLLGLPASATEENYNPNDPLQFVVMVLRDDVVRGLMKFNRDSGLDGFAGLGLLTPTLDSIAAAGFVHQGFHSYTVCTPTRQALAGLGGYDGPNHSHGIVNPDSSGLMDPNLYVNTIWREFGNAGFRSFFVGKWHISTDWSCDSSRSETALEAAGIDESPAYIAANVVDQNSCFDYFGDPLGCWASCRGHKCWAKSAIGGGTALTQEHSSKVIWDEAVAYMQAQTGGKHFISIWLNAPHNPINPGNDVLVCEGNTADRNDWPPGSSQVGTANDVYEENIAYNDLRLADVLAEMDITRDILIDTSDNGVPTTYTALAECEASRGKKKTPWPCGTWVHLVAWGKGVVGGSVVSDIHHRSVDFAPTLLELAGGRSVNHFGKSFAKCITGVDGQSASNCWGREHLSDLKFSPVGSSSGDFRLMPDVQNDPNGMWNAIQPTYEGFAPDGRYYFLRRKYDGNTEPPYSFWEVLAEADPASALGRYVEANASELAITPEPHGGAIDLFNSSHWVVPPTQAQTDFIIEARAKEAREFSRRGRPTTMSGGF